VRDAENLVVERDRVVVRVPGLNASTEEPISVHPPVCRRGANIARSTEQIPIRRTGYAAIGRVEGLLGRCEQSIAHKQFKRAVYSNPTYIAYAFLAGAEAAKGNDAEAKRALTEARRLFPQLTIKWLLTETTPTPSIVIDGLRNAGLPEE
jgi:hypothetical protein